MNCTKIVRMLPDYRIGAGRAFQRRAIEAHLNHCAACREQLRIWENFCTFSAQQIRIPPTLDWTPLEQALAAEMRRVSGTKASAPDAASSSNRRKALLTRRRRPAFPWRFGSPLLIAAAAAMVILSLWLGEESHTQAQLKHKLTLGSELAAHASDGKLVYRETRVTQIYHQEVGGYFPVQNNIPHWQDIPDKPESHNLRISP